MELEKKYLPSRNENATVKCLKFSPAIYFVLLGEKLTFCTIVCTLNNVHFIMQRAIEVEVVRFMIPSDGC